MQLVSVIVPVLNNAGGLGQVLQALLSQTYLAEYTEIIVVDNGSTDGTLAKARTQAQRHPGRITVLEERSRKGIAAARNPGLRHARGAIIAMVDSDCTPMPDWLERGTEALETSGADMLAGRVQFTFSAKPSPAEYYDSIAHLQARHTIPARSHAQTANLFARRRVFDQIGLFDASTTSGADSLWTAKAVDAGFQLAYSHETVVLHPARRLGGLLRKQFRLGTGHPRAWRMRNVPRREILVRVLRNLAPPSRGKLQAMITERGTAEMQSSLWGIWGVAWLCGVATNLGRLYGSLAVSRR
jgi:glycosyltransferase involved in cell wall biosynthesis